MQVLQIMDDHIKVAKEGWHGENIFPVEFWRDLESKSITIVLITASFSTTFSLRKKPQSSFFELAIIGQGRYYIY